MTKIERTTIFFCLFIMVAIGFSTVRGDPFGPMRQWFSLLTRGFSWGMGS